MMSDRNLRRLTAVAVLGGILLCAIGVRFLLDPVNAARSFGLAKGFSGFELQYVVGLRDLWLGGLAIALAALKEWRALALWFALGAAVCFGDAAIAALSSGRTGPVTFHIACGVVCMALAAAFHRAARA